MSRIGDVVLALKVGQTITAISTRPPTLGQKCIIVPDGNGGNIAVKPFNTYEKDEGIVMPLPCGSSAFLPGEPPNYLPRSWESGVTVSCQQGVPSTDGWECKPTCPINPVFNPCPRGANGGRVNDRNPNFCTNENRIHNYWRDHWYKNQVLHPAVYTQTYSCASSCPRLGYCSASGNTTEHRPVGCSYPNKYRTITRTLVSEAYYSYSCNGCPNYNDGKGLIVCKYSPPPFSPGQKPSVCQNKGYLDFTGWNIPGGEGSTASGACTMSKATEGVRTNTSAGDIRCKFSQV